MNTRPQLPDGETAQVESLEELPFEKQMRQRARRAAGLKAAALGLVLLTIAAACAMKDTDLAGDIGFFGVLALVGGTWRALTGEEAGQERRGFWWSVLRIALGLTLLLLFIAAVFAIGVSLSAHRER